MTALSHAGAADVVGRSPPDAGSGRAGIVSILALLFLVIFVSLSVSYTTFANGSLLQGRNHAARLTARLQAESGMSFLVNEMGQISIPTGTGAQALLDVVATGLRELPGSFLLAPGFGVQFSGNFGTVNGAMVAEQFKWTGNAGGTIHGPLISYGNTEFKLTGNSNLTINRATYPGLPPGLVGTLTLEPDVGTYREN